MLHARVDLLSKFGPGRMMFGKDAVSRLSNYDNVCNNIHLHSQAYMGECGGGWEGGGGFNIVKFYLNWNQLPAEIKSLSIRHMKHKVKLSYFPCSWFDIMAPFHFLEVFVSMFHNQSCYFEVKFDKQNWAIMHLISQGIFPSNCIKADRLIADKNMISKHPAFITYWWHP